MPLVALDQISVAFGHLPLLGEATLRIERGERVSVVGRNGAGKSTLLRIISGEHAADAGTVWTEPGLRLATARSGCFYLDRVVRCSTSSPTRWAT